MKYKIKEVTVDGVVYVKKEQMASEDMRPYCIVRTYSAGVFAGYIKRREGREAEVLNARRLWKWKGAATLSQLAMEGVKYPEECKFPCEVTSVTLTEVIEIIPCTEAARKSIAGVPIWKAE